MVNKSAVFSDSDNDDDSVAAGVMGLKALFSTAPRSELSPNLGDFCPPTPNCSTWGYTLKPQELLIFHFCKGDQELPLYCDKEIKLDGVFYDIIGAIYGNGSHFIARHLHDGNIFESDGYRKHVSSRGGSCTVLEALSVEIKEPYEMDTPS
jgi:hypothetical protein